MTKPPDLSRFLGAQQANAQRVLQAKSLEAEVLRRVVVWLSNRIRHGDGDFPQMPDGSLVIPKAELDQVPHTFTLDLPMSGLKEDASCEEHEEFTEGCDGCVEAMDAQEPIPMVIVVVKPKEGGGNGIIQPKGPGLILP